LAKDAQRSPVPYGTGMNLRQVAAEQHVEGIAGMRAIVRSPG